MSELKNTGKKLLKTLLAYEPRILLDAATAPSAAEAISVLPADPALVNIESQPSDQLLQALAELEAPVVDSFARNLQTEAQQLSDINELVTGPDRREVIFIDDTLPGFEALVAAVEGAGNEIVVLDGAQDGLQQIADYLGENEPFDAIHILGHGATGEQLIGTTEINAQSLASQADILSLIGQSLTADGDILLYGCRVAGEDGSVFLHDLAALTGADVAASSDVTGNADQGGDWQLEVQSGLIEADLPFNEASLAAFSTTLDAIDLAGKDGWIPIMTGAAFDTTDDSQAGAGSLDVVGGEGIGVLYAAFDDAGTEDASDDTIAFRVRINNSSDTSDFSRVIVIGMDANADGKIDLFLSVDGRNASRSVRLLDPGTDLNISPSTTSTAALPTGWLPNNGIYPFDNTNFSVVAVSATTDPQW
ncbi:MAG: DUF4347 domain-containing protein, partial [Gammaproteobacteria bacterium]|nr:DUF4347 domain-containing protein [Gammaproteobacteria bacterium]